jgi:hypothetical protein
VLPGQREERDVSAWWGNVRAGRCGRCGTPYKTVPLGGWKNSCDSCYAIRQAKSNRLFFWAIVLLGLGLLIQLIVMIAWP